VSVEHLGPLGRGHRPNASVHLRASRSKPPGEDASNRRSDTKHEIRASASGKCRGP